VNSNSISVASCGQACSGPQDCTGDSRCGTCRLGFCVSAGNCRSYCDPNQDINTWCYNSYCVSCDRATNSCLSDCGQPCTSPSQCITATCGACNNYRCTRACGATCQADSNCALNTDGCLKCTGGVCTKPTGCGASCIANSDCVVQGCTKCVRGQCVVGGCNSICYWTPDCVGQGNCTQCFGRFEPGAYGVCTASCGAPCGDNSQCNGTLTNCGQCLNGTCSASEQCGIGCQNDAGCAGNCHRCVGGVCIKNATCGEACDVNSTCYQTNPKCMFCINSKCGSP